MLQPHILTKAENTKLLKLITIYEINALEDEIDKTLSLQFHWFELLHNADFLRVLFYNHVRLYKNGVGIPYYYYVMERLHQYDPDTLIEFIYQQFYNPTYTVMYSMVKD